MLAEYLKELAESGLNLEAAISGQKEIKKINVVECLRLIGKEDISKILNNKQGTGFYLEIFCFGGGGGGRGLA